MGYVRRVTLRCLCEDLEDDWGNSAEQRGFARLRKVLSNNPKDSAIAEALENVPTTCCASHPLVSGFFSAFDGDSDSVLRESISGLDKPHWWKQKVSRWRGAATDASIVGVGEVWLCAGGLRAAGDTRDFYHQFTSNVRSRGPEHYLPADEDRRLQAVEENIARRDAWLDQVRLSTLICVAEANKTKERATLHVPAPSPREPEEPLLHLAFEVERASDDADELIELFLYVSTQDHSRPNLVQAAIETAQSVIEPVVDAWRVLPGKGTDQIWSVLISAETIDNVLEASSKGEVPDHLRDCQPTLGVQAHHTHKQSIVYASVEGEAIRALCGRWFVPTSNPDDLPVCPTCEQRYSTLT